MERIVSKLKHMVSQPKQANDDDIYNDLVDRPGVAKYQAQNGLSSGPFSDDPQIIRTLIDSIPSRFYLSNSDEVITEEISEYLSDREVTKSQTRITQLAAHNRAVCRRIYQLVLEKQSQYQTELKSVLSLQQDNLEALSLCKSVRKDMNVTIQGLTLPRLIVLSNYRRKSRLNRVRTSLSKIKTLQFSVERLIELLEIESFYQAIQLHRECQAVVDDFRFYKCIDKMRMKLNAIRVNIEEALDSALMRSCEQFDTERYDVLQKSFKLLGNGPSSIDQLQMHYSSIIQNRSFDVVLNFVTDSDRRNSEGLSYSDICRLVPQSQFLECTQCLCSAHFEILRCYVLTVAWHKNDVDTMQNDPEYVRNQEIDVTESDDTISNWSETYQLERMSNNKIRVWTEISNKLKILIEQCRMNSDCLELEDIMRLLNIINKFTNIGIEFCDSTSLDVQDAVRVKFQDFFRSFHLKHLERLKMFLENESWELCPVKKSFSFLDLAEFSAYRNYISNKDSQKIETDDQDNTSYSVFGCPNPFSVTLDSPYLAISNENILDDTDEKSPSTLVRNSYDEEATPVQWSQGPIISNTTLEVCRLIGRYLEIMRLLKPIAMDIVNSLCQLYDYYMFSIFHIFFENMVKLSTDADIVSPKQDSQKLGIVLRRIWDRLILHDSASDGNKMDRIGLPNVTFHSIDKTLPPVIVAVESIVYLGENFLRDSLLLTLSNCLPEAKRGLLKVFSEQNLLCGQYLRRPIYELILKIMYNSDKRLVGLIASTNWNLKTVTAKPSDYVTELNTISKEFQNVIIGLSQTIPVTRELVNMLWQLRMRVTDRYLLEGYSFVTNCSQAGRNLMLVDWQSHVKSTTSVSGCSGLFENSDVEKYIKAFYIGTSEFEGWIKDNCDRYPRQYIINLINLLTKSDKRIRQKWINFLNECTQTS